MVININKSIHQGRPKGKGNSIETKKRVPGWIPLLRDFIGAGFDYGDGVSVDIEPGVLAGPSSTSSVGAGVTRLTLTRRICPGKIEFGSSNSLYSRISSTVLRNAKAIEPIESPGLTIYSTRNPGKTSNGIGVGVGTVAPGAGINTSSPTKRIGFDRSRSKRSSAAL